jgi:uncharacterized OB-fold protein
MYDENNYPTLKYMKCKKCGHVFTGDIDCPECASFDTSSYQPIENPDKEGDTEGNSQ